MNRQPYQPLARTALRVLCVAAFLSVALPLVPSASGAWYDSGWTFRRPVELPADSDQTDSGLAYAEFYAAGHQQPNGADVRVATEEGKLVPSRVLRAGPGDRVKVVFAVQKSVRKYHVYFGNTSSVLAPPPAPPIRAAMQLEMKLLSVAGPFDSHDRIEQAWEQSQPTIGATMIDRPFIGYNPLGEQDRTISKITAMLHAPAAGEYGFAVSADDKAGLWIDGKPVAFAQGAPADARFNGKIALSAGPHELRMYHVNIGDRGLISVGWRKPGEQNWQVIPAAAFGTVRRGAVGPLEELRRSLTADFDVEYLGEAFVESNYSHRYRFRAGGRKSPNLKVEWDFGDGQQAEGEHVEHVFLTGGIYPVRVTFRIGSNSDAQTTQLPVHRDYDRITNPPTDEPATHAAIVATYDVTRLPIHWLQHAALLHERAGQVPAMLAVARRLAAEPKHADPNVAMLSLQQVVQSAAEKGQVAAALSALEAAPVRSDLQPRLAMLQARLLLWRTGEFDRAAKVLQPFANRPNPHLQRAYAHALLLSGKPEEAKQILLSLPSEGPPERAAALSGALARTIEFFIEEGEADAGEEHWERWQSRFPADFLDGYSVLLQVRLMELHRSPGAAARVAEAFAAAMPTSSYSPRLLDRASRILEKTDPSRSAELRQRLKQRYPEDPLSQ